jgi:hypothetical protein
MLFVVKYILQTWSHHFYVSNCTRMLGKLLYLFVRASAPDAIFFALSCLPNHNQNRHTNMLLIRRWRWRGITYAKQRPQQRNGVPQHASTIVSIRRGRRQQYVIRRTWNTRERFSAAGIPAHVSVGARQSGHRVPFGGTDVPLSVQRGQQSFTGECMIWKPLYKESHRILYSCGGKYVSSGGKYDPFGW